MYEDLRDEEKKHVAKIQSLIEYWKGQLEGA
jgi:rubrerythrin